MNLDNKKEKKDLIKKIWFFLKQYNYILLTLYIILTIISIYISLHCNNFFSLETLIAFIVPYIYLPFRYYFGDYCNMPSKMCLA